LREALRSRLAALTGAIVLAVVAIVFARCGEVAQDLFRHVDSDHPLLALLLPPASSWQWSG
jgi:hypothetical protein